MWNISDLLDDLRGLRDDLKNEIDYAYDEIDSDLSTAWDNKILNSVNIHNNEGRVEAFEQVLQQLEDIIEEYDDDADL
jgi:hypothetical protein